MLQKLKLIPFSLLLFVYSAAIAGKSEKHYGKAVTFLGTYEGMITVNLNAANEEMISIELVNTKNKEKGTRTKYTESISVNAKTISSLEIDSVLYIIKNSEYKKDKVYTNCLLTLTNGSKTFGLYQWGTQSSPDKHVLFHKNMMAYTLLSHPDIGGSFAGWLMLLVKCDTLKAELKEKKSFLTPSMDAEAKKQEIIRLINASSNCI